MNRTPGIIVPSGYPSEEAFQKDLDRRSAASGFTPFDPSDFDEEELTHFGVKGMRWGVVRKKGAMAAKKAAKIAARELKPSDDAARAKAQKFKAKVAGVHVLSNAEISAVIRRMKLEQEFKDLYGSDTHIGKGKKFVKDWLAKTSSDTVTSVATSWLGNPMGNGSTAARVGRIIEGSIVNRRAIGS